jgi:hypothetical protein
MEEFAVCKKTLMIWNAMLAQSPTVMGALFPVKEHPALI